MTTCQASGEHQPGRVKATGKRKQKSYVDDACATTWRGASLRTRLTLAVASQVADGERSHFGHKQPRGGNFWERLAGRVRNSVRKVAVEKMKHASVL